MIRKIIKIDEELCNGCGICVDACHEKAIGLSGGKAYLLRDDYCDGLGDCLPTCPTGAISFEEREALAYNEELVKHNMRQNESVSCSCPGSASKSINVVPRVRVNNSTNDSMLRQWPVQIQLAPYNAPYFNNAHLLIAADCTAYSYGNFHDKFMKNKITLIGCPKLDDTDYSEKLQAIIESNNIRALTIVKMEVPCCKGIEVAAKNALLNSGKFIPWQVITISTNGEIIE